MIVHEWIDSESALSAWLQPRPTPALIGLDTEFMRTDTFRARLALVQAEIDGHIAVIDAPALAAHAALASRLRDPHCVCVMHSASEDLEALAGILPAGPATLFDTQIAAAMAGFGFGLSYQKLVAALLGIDLPKGETRSDWLKRPLRPAQLDYAAQDVEHLPQIHAVLAHKLVALGRSQWLAEECQRLVEKVCLAEPDRQPQRALRAAAGWPRPAQALLRRVLLWREATARRLDKPRSWILDDAHALDLVAHSPADIGELFERCKGQRALRSEQRRELFDVLQAPLRDEECDIAPIPAQPSSTEKHLLAQLRDAVTAIAQPLDLPESLLCPRRHLETLVAERTWPAALEGWRKPLLHDALMNRLTAV
ncbi:MAG: ribonuclease D [Rudaea sp.]